MNQTIFQYHSKDEDDTYQLAKKLAPHVKAGDIIALMGDLGMGKTRFVQGFAAGWGISEDTVIHSPTFTFVNEYSAPTPLFHIDLYRLADGTEAETLGLEDIFEAEGVCLIEWADRLDEPFPEPCLYIRFADLGDTERQISFEATSPFSQNILTQFQKEVEKECF